MKKLFHPLLELIARSAENELAAIIQHLKEENRILRDKLPKRVPLTQAERQRLVKTGALLGSAIKEIITIVHYRTFQRWVAAEKRGAPSGKRTKTGRAILATDQIDEVIKIANETGWGATRELARSEVVFAFRWTGAALAAAIEIGERETSKDKMIVVIIPSFSERYITTALFEGI